MKALMHMSKKEASLAAFCYCFAISAGFLLLCSKSSPLYPINDWSDANIFFSMGKGMATGKVIYRDLYDHKGPLLYGLHAVCWWISPGSFLGVWFMEVISGALYLFASWKILSLYGARSVALVGMPVLAMAVFSSFSFQQGDSAEELCLPLMAATLYAWLKYRNQITPKPMERKVLLLNGFFLGCILWIKFTLLGFHAMWALLTVGEPLFHKKGKESISNALWILSGIALSTLPWLLYFSYHGAIADWLNTYFYHNLVLYSNGDGAGIGSRIYGMAQAAWDWIRLNLQYTLLLPLGLVTLPWRRHMKKGTSLSLWLMFGSAGLGVFIGGKSYPYYGLALAAFGMLGLIPLCMWLEKRMLQSLSKSKLIALLLAGLGLFGAGCYFFSPNISTSFGKPKDSTMQYQIATAMTDLPEATLLNFGFMDAGFYMAAEVVPHLKYFHQTNVPLPEMLEEQLRYLQEGLADYVVTRGNEPTSITDHYELVAEADSPGFWYPKVYLYRLKNRIP